MIERPRLSKQQLENISNRLSERDRSILEAISKYRYLTTNQVFELYFNESPSRLAAHRAANRALLKLKELGLLTTLNRRIGGVRAGSSSYVWSLGSAGYRLLSIADSSNEKHSRKRLFEPSMNFLKHTLVIAETSIQLKLISKRYDNVELLTEELEPDCWRPYVSDTGVVNYLKPDMYIVTLSGDFEDYWFFEIDLATESPSRIILKCEQYFRYFQSGTEQRKNSVFPQVVWITLDKKRSDSLRCYIAERFGTKHKDIFAVITPDQLETLICEGLEAINYGSGDEAPQCIADSPYFPLEDL